MKLNIISNDWHPSSNKGGGEKSLFDVLTYLKKMGNDIQLGYTIDGDLLEAYKKNGIKLQKIIRSNVQNKYNPIEYFQLIASALKFQIKKNSIIYINSFYDAPLAVIIKFLYKTPICCHLRIPPDLSRQYIFALKHIDDFIVATDKMKELYANCGIPKNKFTVIPNGFFFKEDLFKKTTINNKIFKIVYLGRIAKEKGIEELIRAYQLVNKRYPNTELQITGPVISQANILFKEKLKQLVKELSLDNNVYLNEPIREPIKYLSKFDLCVFPSTWDEPFGRVIIESICAGTPVICHNVGSVDKIINDPEHTWIYDTADELVTMIIRLINDPDSYELASKLSFMKQHYDIETIVSNINAHLTKIVTELKNASNK